MNDHGSSPPGPLRTKDMNQGTGDTAQSPSAQQTCEVLTGKGGGRS
jgi:hypothetical protein